MKSNRITNQYPLSVWIFTILLTPIFMVMSLGFTENVDIVGQLELIPVFWIMGGLLSSPSLLLFIISNRFIERLSIINVTKKIIFSLIGVTCIIITFKILGGSLATNMTIFYSIMFFILGLSIKRVLT
ncbi:MAG: hypothetical protein KA210_09775 [Bacteroidia bacterium]|nr:hypothetical protein [Bacteroidia bacterium]